MRKMFWALNVAVGAMMLVGASACHKEAKDETLKFAIASDFHAPDIPGGEERVAAFIQAAKNADVDFIIELGDFCRLDSASKVYRDLWASFDGPSYHVVGNHDMDSYTPDEYVEGMGMPGRYYSFDQGNFHFIVMDGNNLFDGKEYHHYSKANYYVDMKMREFADPEQLEWLKKDLESTDKKCVIFCHQSIEQVMANGAEVRKIFEDENTRAGFKKVVLAFSGHTHSNYTMVINGITYMQINSASYVWVDEPTSTELRYSEEINQRYPLLRNSLTFDRALYAIVTLSDKGAVVQGTEAEFLPPTPKELNFPDSVYGCPLVSVIADAEITF